MELFDRGHVVGVFRGFSQGGMEFHADLVMPYRADLQSIPMHGSFILVQLEHEREAVLGRITTISSQGRLVSPIGEDYAVRSVRDRRPIPDDLLDQYLKYKVDIRVLGVLRQDGDKLIFVPSHRRLPHVGAPVAMLAPDVLVEVAGAGADRQGGEVELGHLALGEFVYSGDDPLSGSEPWIVPKHPCVRPRFQIDKLVSRRSFVFARAGYGKSNLIKLLFSRLYATGPTVTKRAGARVPVGTVLFDPDGEYFWPDDKGRPALCDVPDLRDRLVVFTNRHAPSPFYESFTVDGVRLDIRELKPSRVLAIAISTDRQDQQNVAKLRAMSQENWRRLVDLVYANGLGADPNVVADLAGFKAADDVQTTAAISNMTRVVGSLHDPSSQFLTALKTALTAGKLCVVDISQMRGQQGLQLAGVVLSHLFEHNQEEWTKADPRTIPTIAVLEEAQSILGGGGQAEDGPFVAWVKEGRKYDLGAVLVTQQPGSLPQELVSQGDNFFVFHLLSAADLTALKRANAHFSEDLLASLLNEPIVGHGVFWSSAPGTDRSTKPYPLPIRVLDFADGLSPADPQYDREPIENYAAGLRQRLRDAVAGAADQLAVAQGGEPDGTGTSEPVDAQALYRAAAVRQLGEDRRFTRALVARQPVKWGTFQSWLAGYAPPPPAVDDGFRWAYHVVPEAFAQLLGTHGWVMERRITEQGDAKMFFVPPGMIGDQGASDGPANRPSP